MIRLLTSASTIPLTVVTFSVPAIDNNPDTQVREVEQASRKQVKQNQAHRNLRGMTGRAHTSDSRFAWSWNAMRSVWAGTHLGVAPETCVPSVGCVLVLVEAGYVGSEGVVKMGVAVESHLTRVDVEPRVRL